MIKIWGFVSIIILISVSTIPITNLLVNGQKNITLPQVAPPTTPTTYVLPIPALQQPTSNIQSTSAVQQVNSHNIDPLVLAVAFAGAVGGVLYRTIYPYFERIQEAESKGEELKFLAKYKFTALISLSISIITTMGMFSGLVSNMDVGAGIGMIFISSFIQGIGWNELTNRVSYKISDKVTEQDASKNTKTSATDVLKSVIGIGDKDQVSPEIVGKIPFTDKTGVDIATPICISFSKPMDKSKITKEMITLRKEADSANVEPLEIILDEDQKNIVFKPKDSLEKGTKYIVTVSAGVTDQQGNKMTSDKTWSFTTA